MNAHNFKLVKLYSRTGNYTAERKMNFFELNSFPHRPFPFAGLFFKTFSASYLCPNFFPSRSPSFFSLTLSAWCLLQNESTFTLNFYDVALALTFSFVNFTQISFFTFFHFWYLSTDTLQLLCLNFFHNI